MRIDGTVFISISISIYLKAQQVRQAVIQVIKLAEKSNTSAWEVGGRGWGAENDFNYVSVSNVRSAIVTLGIVLQTNSSV